MLARLRQQQPNLRVRAGPTDERMLERAGAIRGQRDKVQREEEEEKGG